LNPRYVREAFRFRECRFWTVLAQLLYADVASSELRALPAGRRPIRTAIRSGAALDRLWSFIASEACAGRGTFVVVPRIGDGDPGEEPSGDAAGDALEVAV